MKACSQCSAVLHASGFQRRAASRDGLTASCKECLREYDKRRYQKDPRVRERLNRYQKTEHGRAVANRAKKKWSDENPVKRAAHVILNNAVRDGKVIKPEECGNCGATGLIDGHHHDYSKPLDVTWLCKPCHAAEHAGDE